MFRNIRSHFGASGLDNIHIERIKKRIQADAIFENPIQYV